MKTHYGKHLQQGATMVEFTITFMVFLIFILAIIEFSLVIYDASRLAEATRVATRYAIVSTPPCNILGKTDENGVLQANASPRCPGTFQLACTGDTVEVAIESCENPATTPECKMVELMDQMMLRSSENSVLSGDGTVRITYACSDTGDPGLSVTPLITVAAEDIQHPMMFTAIFGFYTPGGDNSIGTSITLPRFETTRTGEDMYTE
jgi:hypothetical protein